MRRSSSPSLSSLCSELRRDDRVVVGDLGVVDDAAERQQVEARRRTAAASRVARGRADHAPAIGLMLGDHVARQVARARARVRERLVLLVAALRRGERAARREAEAVVGLALQRGQVVEQRRALLACVFSSFVISPALAARPPRRSPRASARRLRARGWAPCVVAALVDALAVGREHARRPASTARARTRGSPPRGAPGSPASGVCTRPSETAPSNDERRRIVAARVAFMPTIQSASERERAASSRRLQLGAVAQVARTPRWIAALVIEFSHSRCDGQLGAGLLVEVGEDQLALAAGVARVDDAVDVVALEQAA